MPVQPIGFRLWGFYQIAALGHPWGILGRRHRKRPHIDGKWSPRGSASAEQHRPSLVYRFAVSVHLSPRALRLSNMGRLWCIAAYPLSGGEAA